MMLTFSRRESVWGLAFIAPWILGALAFTLLPMAASFVISLTNFDPRYPDAVQAIGLANYQRMLTDPLVLQSLGVTLKFAAVMLPLTLGVSLGLAMLVNVASGKVRMCENAFIGA
jgi:multiple sugar transport system permease protein